MKPTINKNKQYSDKSVAALSQSRQIFFPLPNNLRYKTQPLKLYKSVTLSTFTDSGHTLSLERFVTPKRNSLSPQALKALT